MHSILEDNPLATEVIRDWFMDKMAESFKDRDLPDNFKEFMRDQGITNDRLVKLIEVNPRVLFDVFDANGVIINVVYEVGRFSWAVVHAVEIPPYVQEQRCILLCSSRRQAEKEAVECAFTMLNDKLNSIKDDA
jgi:hypothetical protein